MTMKEIKGKTFKDFYKSFRIKVSNLYTEHKNIRDRLDERDLEKFNKIWFEKEDGDYLGALDFYGEKRS